MDNSIMALTRDHGVPPGAPSDLPWAAISPALQMLLKQPGDTVPAHKFAYVGGATSAAYYCTVTKGRTNCIMIQGSLSEAQALEIDGKLTPEARLSPAMFAETAREVLGDSLRPSRMDWLRV